MRPSRNTLVRAGIGLAVAVGVPALILLGYIVLVAIPNLPALDALTDYRPKIPLRVYTADKVLIGEFGVEHRDFMPIKDIPDMMKKALLVTEDSDFYEHGAVSAKGLLRAVFSNLVSRSRSGGGTITMQVAREFFLSREKKLTRKINEIAIAYKIERTLSKDQILELYMNQIYLGEHAYGFAGAAQVYFGKPLKELTLAETAMLAGLPQQPTTHNPIANPTRAKQRQLHVLQRLRETGNITEAQYALAVRENLHLHGSGNRGITTHAEYVAEMVRQVMYKQYKEDAYTHGYSVYTTINKTEQDAAYDAVRRGVLDYDRRRGYRGPEGHVELSGNEKEHQDAIDEALQDYVDSDNLLPAVVLSAGPKLVRAQMQSGDVIDISGDGLHFVASALTAGAAAQKKITPGAVIRVSMDGKNKWSITQLPEVSAAFIALDAQDGSYRAMVGGFDFNLNKFDHVNQAWRQPGSSFKPFVYSAALEKGFSPATMINDVPLTVSRAENGGGPVWEPKNDDGFAGPVSLRQALAHSKNVPAVRVLRAITPDYAQPYVMRFGFDTDKIPSNLTMVLGTGSVTPMQMAGAYAIFANGGFQLTPYLIRKVVDAHGAVLSEAKPVLAGQETTRVLDQRNAFVMDSLLREVVRSGTGALATQKLGRPDLAGKTGTTSDALDGWFAGYSGNVVAVSWMGYDDPQSLGNREFGATLALPAWIQYMQTALKGKPVYQRPVPDGVSQVDGDWMYNEFIAGGAIKSLGFEENADAVNNTAPVQAVDGIPQDIARPPDAGQHR